MSEAKWTVIDENDPTTWPPENEKFVTDEGGVMLSVVDPQRPGKRLWCQWLFGLESPPFRAWYPWPPKFVEELP